GFRARALKIGGDLNGGKIHLRQRRDRQERIGDQADEGERRHEQRGGDRPAGEGPGGGPEVLPGPAGGAVGADVTVTGASFCSLYCPSVTMRSPPLRPLATTVRSR